MFGLKKQKVKRSKFSVISDLIITILAIIVLFLYAKSEKNNIEEQNINKLIENVQDLTNSSFNEINGINNTNSIMNEANNIISNSSVNTLKKE